LERAKKHHTRYKGMTFYPSKEQRGANFRTVKEKAEDKKNYIRRTKKTERVPPREVEKKRKKSEEEQEGTGLLEKRKTSVTGNQGEIVARKTNKGTRGGAAK